MLFYLVRHGDPIYKPDSLTPLGELQAAAVAKRLAVHGIDRVFSSPLNRARQTAQPTCDLVKKEMTVLDWCSEHDAFAALSVTDPAEGKKKWMFSIDEMFAFLNSDEIRSLGERWYEHPRFAETQAQTFLAHLCDESDALFASLGYEHDRVAGVYRAVAPTDERVALFAHQGFGLAFLSCLLNIPYPHFVTHFNIQHSGVTAIEFRNRGGIVVPYVLQLSSDAHLWRENLPTKYNNRIDI